MPVRPNTIEAIVHQGARALLFERGYEPWHPMRKADAMTAEGVLAGEPEFADGEPTYGIGVPFPLAYQNHGVNARMFMDHCRTHLRAVLGEDVPLPIINVENLMLAIETNQEGFDRLSEKIGRYDAGDSNDNVVNLQTRRERAEAKGSAHGHHR